MAQARIANYKLPVRLARFDGWHSFRLADRLWQILFSSLPLDCLLFLYITTNDLNHEPSITLKTIVGCLLALAILGTTRLSFSSLNSKLQGNHDSTIRSKDRALKIGLIAVTAVGLLPILFKLKGIGLAPLIGFGAMLLMGIPGAREYMKSYKREAQMVRYDRVRLLENLNRQNLVFVVVPIIAARALLLLGAIETAANDYPVINFSLLFVISALLLINLKPEKEQFVSRCQRCASWTSRVLEHAGFCPNCAREAFLLPIPQPAKHTSARRSTPGSRRVPDRRSSAPKLFKAKRNHP